MGKKGQKGNHSRKQQHKKSKGPAVHYDDDFFGLGGDPKLTRRQRKRAEQNQNHRRNHRQSSRRMGNQLSYEPVDDDTPARSLRDRSIGAIAEYIKSDDCKNIVVMCGAGISTSAGIPDFRSPDTGIYASLAHLNIQPESVFDISFFRQNPLPFYTLAAELYPGRFRPTVTHSFVHLLHKKGKLHRCYTQNIDTLERMAGVPDFKIIEAHGSFASQRCIECKTPFPEEEMKQMVSKKEIPYCQVPGCNGYVKPDIVFFGEPLPSTFSSSVGELAEVADMGIVMGTSLSVFPFAALPLRIADGKPRLLINQEQVGEVGSRSDDVLLLGDCDSGVRRLCDALGWRDELENLWAATELPLTAEETERAEREANMTAEERIEAELNRIASDVEASLKKTEAHKDRVNAQLNKDLDERQLKDKEDMDAFKKLLDRGITSPIEGTASTAAVPDFKSRWSPEPDSPTLGLDTDEGEVDEVAKKLGVRLNIADPDVASTTPKINTPGSSTPAALKGIVDPDKTVNIRDKVDEGSAQEKKAE